MTHYQVSRLPGVDGKPLVVYGRGAHGQVVAEAAEVQGWQVLGFLDDAPEEGVICKWPTVGKDQVVENRASVVVAIGDNLARRRVMLDVLKAHWPVENVIHPGAWVSPSAVLGRGVFVGAGAVINAQANVADGVVVNSGAIIEHHCQVGVYSHIAPGATLTGKVCVGELTLVGAGATVVPGVRVGNDCVVAAGATVVGDVADRQRVAGVPARVMG